MTSVDSVKLHFMTIGPAAHTECKERLLALGESEETAEQHLSDWEFEYVNKVK